MASTSSFFCVVSLEARQELCKITVYLGRRDFVDNVNNTEPIDGVVLCDNDYLRGRKIYAQVNVTYRVGREEDEVMGLHFSKELHLLTEEISPGKCPEGKVTEVQERLVNKLGPNASPFFINLPETTPCSVQLHPGAEGTAKPSLSCLSPHHTDQTIPLPSSHRSNHPSPLITQAKPSLSPHHTDQTIPLPSSHRPNHPSPFITQTKPSLSLHHTGQTIPLPSSHRPNHPSPFITQAKPSLSLHHTDQTIPLIPLPFITQAKPLGIIYELKVFVGEEPSEKPHRRNSVTLAVRKVQYCPSDRYSRQPSTMANKGFTFSSGKLNMEVSLDKELYYHGEQIQPQVAVTNNSKKTVKNIRCSVVQHIEVTMTNTQFEREVAGFETKEGCPITPQCHFKKLFTILPHVNNKNKFGIALDGKVKDTDANLASSTLLRENENGQQDALGIVVSYSLRVRLYCGAIAGELLTDLPFKLVHPQPTGATQASLAPKAVTTNAKNDAVGLEVEEFSNLRRGMSVDDNL
ncbi:hypothetical protein Pcinc_027838 [Petrolisthes cinctipes]|uniref:Arrestin C-terminal-like domain-containing protein n=1 Tax=Petrolisthes cinctipes TaxID=88211 RepID=A0AAE1F4B5_PETCI|nr:hypothetical protein Pcinc_027838 [Petrolisthes cinctipes]